MADGILDIMRGIDFDSEIKFAPEGTTEADLFGVYEDEEDEEIILIVNGPIEDINFDELY